MYRTLKAFRNEPEELTRPLLLSTWESVLELIATARPSQAVTWGILVKEAETFIYCSFLFMVHSLP